MAKKVIEEEVIEEKVETIVKEPKFTPNPKEAFKQWIRDYFFFAYKKIEEDGTNTSFMSKQQFEAMLEWAFNTL